MAEPQHPVTSEMLDVRSRMNDYLAGVCGLSLRQGAVCAVLCHPIPNLSFKNEILNRARFIVNQIGIMQDEIILKEHFLDLRSNISI